MFFSPKLDKQNAWLIIFALKYSVSFKASSNLNVDILAITKTRITADCIPHNYNLPNYILVTTKTESTAGGTALYIHKPISFKTKEDLNKRIYCSKLLELTFVEIVSGNHSNMIVGSIYKHPMLAKNEFTDNYISFLIIKDIDERKLSVFLGDFNIDLSQNKEKKEVNHFLDILSSHSFFPRILLPTRITQQTETLVDNIKTNSTKHEIISGNLNVSISDNLTQFTILKNVKNKKETHLDKYYKDWKSFKQDAFVREFQSIDWKNILQFDKLDPNLTFENFFNELSKLIEKNLPIKKLINERDDMYQNFHKTKDIGLGQAIYQDYKLIRNQVTSKIRKSNQNYFNTNIKNTRKIWIGIRELISSKTDDKRNNITLTSHNIIDTEGKKVANLLNNLHTNLAKDI